MDRGAQMTKDIDKQLKFQGVVPYPPENKVDDWHLNVEQQASRATGLGLDPTRKLAVILRQVTRTDSLQTLRPGCGACHAQGPTCRSTDVLSVLCRFG